jgi:hypothetical protein
MAWCQFFQPGSTPRFSEHVAEQGEKAFDQAQVEVRAAEPAACQEEANAEAVANAKGVVIQQAPGQSFRQAYSGQPGICAS